MTQPRQTRSDIPLVFLHAAGTGAAMWKPQTARLQGRNTVAAVDLPGHGSRADQPFTFSAALHCVEQALTSLGRPAILVGASQGGYVAAMAAGTHPELVSGLVLSGVLPRITGWLSAKCRIVAAIDAAAVMLLSRLAPHLLQRIIACNLTTQTGGLAGDIISSGLRPTARAECLRALAAADLRPYLRSYLGPVLIANGGRDRVAIRQAPHLAALTARAGIATITGAGHLPSVDAPEEFSAALAAFAHCCQQGQKTRQQGSDASAPAATRGNRSTP